MIDIELSALGTIDPELSSIPALDCSLSTSITHPEYPDYDGEYTVTPDWESQTLKTQNKIMRSDVVVGAIYLNSAQNPAGGNTVYIGG